MSCSALPPAVRCGDGDEAAVAGDELPVASTRRHEVERRRPTCTTIQMVAKSPSEPSGRRMVAMSISTRAAPIASSSSVVQVLVMRSIPSMNATSLRAVDWSHRQRRRQRRQAPRPAASTRLTRRPCTSPPCPASRAPNTAMASAPPIWRLVLNTPLAVPAWWSGTLLSSTAVTGGIVSGPASPTRIISSASAHTGVDAGAAAMTSEPHGHHDQAGR